MPDLNKQFIVRPDASSEAIGAVLLQKHNDILKPCYYVSRKLVERECNYPIIEKECTAIVFALHQFSKYLLMNPFIVQPDHKPLTFLKMNKTKKMQACCGTLYHCNHSLSKLSPSKELTILLVIF